LENWNDGNATQKKQKMKNMKHVSNESSDGVCLTVFEASGIRDWGESQVSKHHGSVVGIRPQKMSAIAAIKVDPPAAGALSRSTFTGLHLFPVPKAMRPQGIQETKPKQRNR
jgi:hypothetical protein